MDKKLAVEYQSFVIAYSEYADQWAISRDKDELTQRSSLKEAKEYCDNKIKREQNPKNKFQPVPCWYSTDLERVTITSVDDNGGPWIRHEHGDDFRSKGAREKAWYLDRLYPVCPENEPIIKKIQKAKNKVAVLGKYIDAEIDLLKKWQAPKGE